MTTQNFFPRKSYVRVVPFHTPSTRRWPSQREMNFWRSSLDVCWISSR